MPHVIKKRECIISLVKKWSARYLKNMHKFGVILPKSVDEDYNIDADNGNVLWNNSIAKGITDVKVAFKAFEDGEDVPIGYSYVRCHMIFRIKYRFPPGKHHLLLVDTLLRPQLL